MYRRYNLIHFFALCALAVLISACQSTAVADTAVSSDVEATIPTIAFKAQDLAFDGPATIAGGWVRLELSNQGSEYYHLQLVQLMDGKTVDDLREALRETLVPPDWATMRGGPNAVDPGASTTAVVYLEPGDYALVDTVPDRQGVPHIMNGMIRALTVVAPDQQVTEPKADTTIDLVDFSFVVDGALTAGERTFRIDNTGEQVHEIWLARLGEGKHVNDLLMALAPDSPAEDWVYNGLGGLAWIEPGSYGYFTADLTPGRYALICFVPDPKTGQMHFMQGMVHEFVVE